MVSTLPCKQRFFHFTRKCIFASRDHKLQSYQSIATVFQIKIFHKLSLLVIHTCIQMTLAFFVNIRALQKLKMFQTRNLKMCANILLILSCQFSLVKIKLNALFPVGKKVLMLNITCNSNTIKQFNQNIFTGVFMVMKILMKINSNLHFFHRQKKFLNPKLYIYIYCCATLILKHTLTMHVFLGTLQLASLVGSPSGFIYDHIGQITLVMYSRQMYKHM